MRAARRNPVHFNGDPCAARAALPTRPARRDSAPALHRTSRTRKASSRCCSSLPVRVVRAGSDADRRRAEERPRGQAWSRLRSQNVECQVYGGSSATDTSSVTATAGAGAADASRHSGRTRCARRTRAGREVALSISDRHRHVHAAGDIRTAFFAESCPVTTEVHIEQPYRPDLPNDFAAIVEIPSARLRKAARRTWPDSKPFVTRRARSPESTHR